MGRIERILPHVLDLPTVIIRFVEEIKDVLLHPLSVIMSEVRTITLMVVIGQPSHQNDVSYSSY